MNRIGKENIITIVDANPNVCRFGLGSLDLWRVWLEIGPEIYRLQPKQDHCSVW